jgi:hypothetical protein
VEARPSDEILKGADETFRRMEQAEQSAAACALLVAIVGLLLVKTTLGLVLLLLGGFVLLLSAPTWRSSRQARVWVAAGPYLPVHAVGRRSRGWMYGLFRAAPSPAGEPDWLLPIQAPLVRRTRVESADGWLCGPLPPSRKAVAFIADSGQVLGSGVIVDQARAPVMWRVARPPRRGPA